MEHLEENIAARDVVLSEEELNQLKDIFAPEKVACWGIVMHT